MFSDFFRQTNNTKRIFAKMMGVGPKFVYPEMAQLKNMKLCIATIKPRNHVDFYGVLAENACGFFV